jgi:hypothetical protein
MGRKVTGGALYPVTLFDANGDPTGNLVDATARDSVPGQHSAPAANNAAVVTLAAPGAGRSNVVASVEWSYSAAPTGGQLTIANGISTWTVYVTDGGPGFFRWEPPKRYADNRAVTVTLAAGGAAVSGTVNVHAWIE